MLLSVNGVTCRPALQQVQVHEGGTEPGLRHDIPRLRITCRLGGTLLTNATRVVKSAELVPVKDYKVYTHSPYPVCVCFTIIKGSRCPRPWHQVQVGAVVPAPMWTQLLFYQEQERTPRTTGV
jgi:hypothetical protein